jgi:hypothetical protein
MDEELDWEAERADIAASAAGREALIAQSFARITGSALAPPGGDVAAVLWNLPAAIVAHGTEADPVFFYGNRAALALFGFSAEEFARLPSRLSAEPAGRAARAKLMARVERDNFVAGYSGVRISKKGARFRIEGATVWNLIDGRGALCGQAAIFSNWTPLAD